VLGVPVAEDALAVQAAFDWGVASSFTAGIEYTGRIATGVQSHAVKANLSIAF
jgi:subtilase-type serine protease